MAGSKFKQDHHTNSTTAILSLTPVFNMFVLSVGGFLPVNLWRTVACVSLLFIMQIIRLAHTLLLLTLTFKHLFNL